jgi:hypothetical protein
MTDQEKMEPPRRENDFSWTKIASKVAIEAGVILLKGVLVGIGTRAGAKAFDVYSGGNERIHQPT